MCVYRIAFVAVCRTVRLVRCKRNSGFCSSLSTELKPPDIVDNWDCWVSMVVSLLSSLRSIDRLEYYVYTNITNFGRIHLHFHQCEVQLKLKMFWWIIGHRGFIYSTCGLWRLIPDNNVTTVLYLVSSLINLLSHQQRSLW